MESNIRWVDTSVAISSGAVVTNQATYTVTGLIPGGRYEVTLNGEPFDGGVKRASAEGELTLEVDLSDAPQTINIFEGQRSTVLMLR